MSIITFYSYKGGVGRSLALANVAVLMAKAGKKVLVIDWDLEAPGLEEYFDSFRLNADGRGLLSMLVNKADLDGHLWTLTDTEERFSLDFLPSGRDESDYYPMLERFNQDDFFRDGGGEYLEQMRSAWKERYDHVLIDSRTGLSDASGVCTIFMPDIIVGLFTATKQSYRGVRDVVELAQHSRRDLAYSRPMFSFVPVPCRIDDQGTEDVGWWMGEFTDAMVPLMDSWRPKELPARAVLEGLRVDHVGELSQGTEIIQGAESEAAAKALGTYETLARLLGSGLTDVSEFKVGADSETVSSPKENPTFLNRNSLASELHDTVGAAVARNMGQRLDKPSKPSNPYRYDVYFSTSSGSFESSWVEDLFAGPFKELLSHQLGRLAHVFSPERELSVGSNWRDEIDDALDNSKIMLVFVTGRTSRSDWSLNDIYQFRSADPKRPIVPILLGGDLSQMPEEIRESYCFDFREHFVTQSGSKYLSSNAGDDMLRKVADVAKEVAKLLAR